MKKQTTLDALIKPAPKKATKKETKKEATKEEEEEEKKAPPTMKELKPIKIAPASEPFPPFEDWIAELGDWQEPLGGFLKSNVMRDIHEYVMEEYAKDTVRAEMISIRYFRLAI